MNCGNAGLFIWASSAVSRRKRARAVSVSRARIFSAAVCGRAGARPSHFAAETAALHAVGVSCQYLRVTFLFPQGHQRLVAENANEVIAEVSFLLRRIVVVGQRLRKGGKGFLQDVVGLQRRKVPPQVLAARRRVAGDELRPPRVAYVAADLAQQSRGRRRDHAGGARGNGIRVRFAGR